MPFFSVIIPLYNKEKYIGETLKSVLNQTFQDFEVIIVNDGSTDRSLEIVSSFDDIRIKIFNQEKKGVSSARNTGVEMAQSKLIAFIDADDIWMKDHLKQLTRLIKNFPTAGLYCMNYYIKYSKRAIRPAFFYMPYENDCVLVDDFFKASLTNCIAWTSAVCIPKKVFREIGCFDVSLITAQDLDLWIRIALNYPVAFNPKRTMLYDLDADNSLSKNEFNNIRYAFISKYKYYERRNPSLKTYLDINRYALAIRSFLNDDLVLYKKVKDEIDLKNLNSKQRILLKMPKGILKLAKNIQKRLLLNNFYLTTYK